MHVIMSSDLIATFHPMGARLMALEYNGVDVVFGPPLDLDISKDDASAGAICGRHAGRISHARFKLDGREWPLVPTSDGLQLHGGPHNFAKTEWTAQASDSEVTFTLTSPDGDQGFPGAVKAKVVYGVKGKTLWAELTATTSKPTVINLTNHAYWNLAGPPAAQDAAFAQEAQINATQHVPLNDQKLPTGEIVNVADTRFDFRALRQVREAYDNCWVLDGPRGMMKHAVTLRDPASGRRMEVWTTEAAAVFYTASHWSPALRGKTGPLQQHQAIAIEAQNIPDAPNNPNFPSSFWRPGQTYRNRIEWRFS